MVIDDPYLTRSISESAIVPRPDPVLHGPAGSPGPLDAKQLTQFDRDGFLFVPALFQAAELQEAVDQLHALRGDPAVQAMCETVTEPGSSEVRSIFRIHETSAPFQRLSRSRRIVSLVEQLLGSQTYIHQSRVNYKPGFSGKEFYWHSDFETWHAEDGMPQPRAVSASVLLTENYPYNGPVMVIPGSHRWFVRCVGRQPKNHYQQSLKKQEYGVPDQASLEKLVEMGGIQAPTGPAGSVLFFECNLMHGSNGNITPYARSNAFFVYNSISNTCRAPYYADEPRPEYIAARKFTPVEPID